MALLTVESMPTNTLEAVNLALRYMREPPIDDLALINTSYAAEQAYRAVIQSTRAIQRRDYGFNRYKLTLSSVLDPASGQFWMKAPDAATKVTLDPQSMRYVGDVRPMIQGFIDDGMTTYTQYIIDSNGQGRSKNWGAVVTLDLLVTVTLPFDALPEAAKALVALEAAAVMGETSGEGIENSPFHTLALQEAQADLMNYDLTVDPVNFYSTLDMRH